MSKIEMFQNKQTKSLDQIFCSSFAEQTIMAMLLSMAISMMMMMVELNEQKRTNEERARKRALLAKTWNNNHACSADLQGKFSWW